MAQHLRDVQRGYKDTARGRMGEAVKIIQDHIKNTKLRGSPLKRRTGVLSRSVTTQVTSDGRTGRVGTNLVYGPIHEFGGVIRPKNAKFLAIPLSGASTKAGVQRAPIRSWGDTTVIPSKRTPGNWIVIGANKSERQQEVRREMGKSPYKLKIIPLFVLAKFARIPKRPYFTPSLRECQQKVFEVFGKSIAMVVRRQ